MARSKRFELLTPRFVVWCSIQLSYDRASDDVRLAEAPKSGTAAPLAISLEAPLRLGNGFFPLRCGRAAARVSHACHRFTLTPGAPGRGTANVKQSLVSAILRRIVPQRSKPNTALPPPFAGKNLRTRA